MNLRWRLGLKHAIAVDSTGTGGGLALFWHESIDVHLIEMHRQFIDVHVRESSTSPRFRITFVYGEPRTEDRHLMWELMRRLHGASGEPWLLIGDFNEAMWSYEHFSACQRPERQMAAFRDVLADCGLTDLGFVGLPFTYDDGREGNANVKVRLDTVVADSNWRDLFSASTLHHLVSSRSDHCPLLLEIKKESWERHKPRIFGYEIMWERLESLALEIKEAWCTAPNREGLGGIASALVHVQRALRSWSRENFGAITKELDGLRVRLETMKEDPHTSRSDIRLVTDRMDELLYREEMTWLQRSRIAWLREGDRNARYFHRQAMWRARKNKITKLKNQDNEWCEDPKVLQSMAVDFFRDLYSADSNVDASALIELMDAKITDEMNVDLCRSFSAEEISDALFQMGPLKAPGPDGFPARFYQRHWEVLKNDVVAAVQKSLKTASSQVESMIQSLCLFQRDLI
jgi:hypothetical protein